MLDGDGGGEITFAEIDPVGDDLWDTWLKVSLITDFIRFFARLTNQMYTHDHTMFVYNSLWSAYVQIGRSQERFRMWACEIYPQGAEDCVLRMSR